jgi:hypothetical protein
MLISKCLTQTQSKWLISRERTPRLSRSRRFSRIVWFLLRQENSWPPTCICRSIPTYHSLNLLRARGRWKPNFKYAPTANKKTWLWRMSTYSRWVRSSQWPFSRFRSFQKCTIRFLGNSPLAILALLRKCRTNWTIFRTPQALHMARRKQTKLSYLT